MFLAYFYYLCLFVKQKTAYDMRSSDWSSDVCSSYLILGAIRHLPGCRLRCLVGASQSSHHTAHEALVVTDGDAPISMGNHVIPGGHLLMEFVLGRIPIG